MSLEQRGGEPEVEQVKESAKPKLIRRFFQFRLLALLLLVVPVAFAATHVRGWLDDRPVDWKPYFKAELDQHIREKETVLVFMKADWCTTSSITETLAFDSQSVRQIIRSRGIIVMKADYTQKPSQELNDLRKVIGRPDLPHLVIYSPQSQGDPVVLEEQYGPELDQKLCTALERNSSRW